MATVRTTVPLRSSAWAGRGDPEQLVITARGCTFPPRAMKDLVERTVARYAGQNTTWKDQSVQRAVREALDGVRVAMKMSSLTVHHLVPPRAIAGWARGGQSRRGRRVSRLRSLKAERRARAPFLPAGRLPEPFEPRRPQLVCRNPNAERPVLHLRTPMVVR